MVLEDKVQHCQLIRDQIDELISTELYPIEQLENLVQQLYLQLQQAIQPAMDTEQLTTFLQQNLDWLQETMAKLSTERETVAQAMLKIQQGKRARLSYGQNN